MLTYVRKIFKIALSKSTLFEMRVVGRVKYVVKSLIACLNGASVVAQIIQDPCGSSYRGCLFELWERLVLCVQFETA